MTKELKKKILISKELVRSGLGAFFKSVDFELCTECVEGEQYDFAVDDVCAETFRGARLQTKDRIAPELFSQVRGHINADLLNSDEGKKLLTSYYRESGEFDITERYSKELKNIYTVKIHEYLNIGFFIDSIVVEAYKGGFDILKLRNFLNTVTNYAFRKLEDTIELMPIEMSYSHDGSAFTVQISLMTEHFEGKAEFQEIIGEMIENTNYFDVIHFEKTKRLSISTLMFKDPELESAKAYFFTEIIKRSLPTEVLIIPAEIHSGFVIKESIPYVAKKLPENEKTKKVKDAKKISTFIINYRKNEELPKPLIHLQMSDIDNYLKFYTTLENVKNIDDETRRIVLKLVKNDEIFSGVYEHIKKISNSNLDTEVATIQEILGNKSLRDIEDIINTKNESGVDGQGMRKWVEESDGTTLVKGQTESLTDEELWEIRKSRLNVRIQDEVHRLNAEGKNIVQDDIIRVLSEEIKARERDVKAVVNEIVEEAVSDNLVKKQKLEESFAVKMLSSDNLTSEKDEVKEKLESQVARMKKLMEQLKVELIKLNNEKNAREAEIKRLNEMVEASSGGAELKNALVRSMDVIKTQERHLDKAKNDLKEKEQKIISLEYQLEEKDVQVEYESKRILASLELANKKVALLEGSKGQRVSTSDDKEKEIESLKSSISRAQIVIERFKQENADLEGRLREEKENYKKFVEDDSVTLISVPKEEWAEKDGLIRALNTDKKILEEKIRAQSMDLKKVEQKLKYSISQLETSDVKKAAANFQKSSEAHVKQLEQANSRVLEATLEVGEKRKEIMKLKQENSLLLSKVAEAEKKLAHSDKKAS